MLFTMPRKLTLTGGGHVIDFVKGEPTYVPPALWLQAQEQGGEPSEPIDEAAVEGAVTAPADGTAEREAALFEAFEALKLKNNPKDFTAGGTPKVASVSKFLGWDAESDEIAAGYAKFKQGV